MQPDGIHPHVKQGYLRRLNRLCNDPAMRIDSSQLVKEGMLGEGGFGFVELCTLKNKDGEKKKVAVKRFHPSILSDDTCLKLLVHELEVMAKVRHKHLVQLVGIGSIGREGGGGSSKGGVNEGVREGLFIVQESCFGGTLKQAINNHKDSIIRGGWGLTAKDLISWSIQLASALSFLHRQSPAIIHRDIKLDNILLTTPLRQRKKREELIDLRLIDFGLACPLTKGDADTSDALPPGHLGHQNNMLFAKIGAAFSRISHNLTSHPHPHPHPHPDSTHNREAHSQETPHPSNPPTASNPISSAFSRTFSSLRNADFKSPRSLRESSHALSKALVHSSTATRMMNQIVYKEWELGDDGESDGEGEGGIGGPATRSIKSQAFTCTLMNEPYVRAPSMANSHRCGQGSLAPSASLQHSEVNPLATAIPTPPPHFHGSTLQISISKQPSVGHVHGRNLGSPTLKRIVSERIVNADTIAEDQPLNFNPNIISMGPLEVTLELSGQTGSFLYMSPEVYMAQPYNEKADVFSYAIVLHELIHRKVLLYHVFDLHPTATDFSPASVDKMLEKYAEGVCKGHRPPIDPTLPSCLTELMIKCWAQKASDRPSMAEVLSALERIEREEDLSSLDVTPISSGGCCG